MATTTIVWIAVAVIAAMLLIALVAVMARKRRDQRKHVEAEQIRGDARERAVKVDRREALAHETAAKGRAAQAEAEAKAAEAARLLDRADTHRTEAASDRDELNDQWERADSIDPATQQDEASQSGDEGEVPTHERREEQSDGSDAGRVADHDQRPPVTATAAPERPNHER